MKCIYILLSFITCKECYLVNLESVSTVSSNSRNKVNSFNKNKVCMRELPNFRMRYRFSSDIKALERTEFGHMIYGREINTNKYDRWHKEQILFIVKYACWNSILCGFKFCGNYLEVVFISYFLFLLYEIYFWKFKNFIERNTSQYKKF